MNLEEKAINYLRRTRTNFIEDSVTYRGVMQDVELPNGGKKDMHVIGYQSWFGQDQAARLCYIYADTQTDSLELLITPHIYESIVDEE